MQVDETERLRMGVERLEAEVFSSLDRFFANQVEDKDDD
jgi:hypothetical protein